MNDIHTPDEPSYHRFTDTFDVDLEPVIAATRDTVNAALDMDEDAARYCVDLYYSIQKFRIATEANIRSTGKGRITGKDEPVPTCTEWARENLWRIERTLYRGLRTWVLPQERMAWALSMKGIGYILSAGLAAHIDIRLAPTAGALWRFAGLDPTIKWDKKQKRPYNARLKVLCWKISESFCKVSGHADAFYGQLWRRYKDLEIEKNDAGLYAEAAAHELATKNYDEKKATTNHLRSGRLAPAHINRRAGRKTVKMFLSHLHTVLYWYEFKEAPPVPYVFAMAPLEHEHYMPVPSWCPDGFIDAMRRRGYPDHVIRSYLE